MKNPHLPLPSQGEKMPSRGCILQEVFKEFREIIRAGPLESYIRGISFESRRSKIYPIKIRWRIYHPNNSRE